MAGLASSASLRLPKTWTGYDAFRRRDFWLTATTSISGRTACISPSGLKKDRLTLDTPFLARRRMEMLRTSAPGLTDAHWVAPHPRSIRIIVIFDYLHECETLYLLSLRARFRREN